MARYFVSGHLDLTQEQFDLHYKEAITTAAVDQTSTFVMGDARGTDSFAFNLLCELVSLDRIAIYHRGRTPRQTIKPGCNLVGMFKTDEERDTAMTLNSDIDIAWVRLASEASKLYGSAYNPHRISGTQRNLDRRLALKSS